MPTPQTRSHKRQRGIEPISTSEARALLAACNRGTTGLRAKALVLIMWRAGLRVGEALALLPRDVETDHGIVRVREGKTGSRVVPLDPEACAELGRWMDRRKALGATKFNILMQFVIEALTIGVLGGLLGIALGGGGAWVLANVIGWNVFIAPEAVLLAVLFSIGVGLIFGIWPARRAAQLDPIEALRHD